MMKQVALALLCAALFAADVGAALADPASDRDMASRYMQAAQSGDDDAEFYIGALYSAGVGLAASDTEAFHWFSRAADQGHSHAMLILAGLYATGRGTAKDNVKSYKWAYIVSSGSRVDEFRNGAGQLMGVLEARMTPDEISLAKANATSWHAVPATGQARPSSSAIPINQAPQPMTVVSPASSGTSPATAPQGSQAQSSVSLLASPATKTIKKDDLDNLLDQVPHGLRKRFGF
jgi:TPR repeat protein